MTTRFDHPVWLTALATGTAYLLVLLVAFLALFVLPYLAFVSLGG